MSPFIIVGLVILSFMSVKSFTGNPIDKEAKADIKAMERRLDPASDADAAATETEQGVPQEQAQNSDNASPVAIIQVPGANSPQAEILDPQDSELPQGEFPSDGETVDDQLGVEDPDDAGEELPDVVVDEPENPFEDDPIDVSEPEEPTIDFPEGDQTPEPIGDIFPDNNDNGFGSSAPQSRPGFDSSFDAPIQDAPEPVIEPSPAADQSS